VVGLVDHHSVPHPLRSGALVDNTRFHCSVRRADLGNNLRSQQLIAIGGGKSRIPQTISPCHSEQMKLLRYVELKTGHADNGPAWIGYVTPSKTGRTLYFNGRGLMKLKGQRRGASGGNYIDLESGESFWVSGVKKNGEDRHWAGSGKVLIEAAAVSDYLKAIGAKTLDASRCEVTNDICQTDIERLSRLANASGKGWPTDPEEAQDPYSFIRNVSRGK